MIYRQNSKESTKVFPFAERNRFRAGLMNGGGFLFLPSNHFVTVTFVLANSYLLKHITVSFDLNEENK